MEDDKRYRLVDMGRIEPVDCPCGSTRRAFTEEPEKTASLHIVDIKKDSVVHYHKKLTEIYYILDGEGHIQLDGESVPVRPGSAILIKPLCRHRAVGALKVLNVPIPAFDPTDEWTD
jgi:mannose-6-phosphate isomerase-like protein (cupin superfamily)